MILSIKLNPDNAVVSEGGAINWAPALVKAAEVVQLLNDVAASELENGPIACDKEALHMGGYLGNSNTPPGTLGLVNVMINNYNQLRLSPDFIALVGSAFIIVAGQASGPAIDEEGATYTEHVGRFAGLPFSDDGSGDGVVVVAEVSR